MNETTFDLTEAVDYHYNGFPPLNIDASKLLRPISEASSAIARYDQMLKGMHNSSILLAPLRNQEAVISSRMEGTVSTLDEVLQYEADQESGEQKKEAVRHRQEAMEVALYSHALRNAQKSLEEGAPISPYLVRSAHKQMLLIGRGASSKPGEFKTEQNYIADQIKKKILFRPISPNFLNDGLDLFFKYVSDEGIEPLIQAAVSHLEFEALHPFKDGNGRIGRMLITLLLWQRKVISEPHFYVSAYFEKNRDEYIDRMRGVSTTGEWTGWIVFFLRGLEAQAMLNLSVSENIKELYDAMKDRFREILSSQWSVTALDFVFSTPIFRNNTFTSKSGIPAATAHRFTRILSDEGLLRTIIPPSGRRPAMYAFEPLLKIVRS